MINIFNKLEFKLPISKILMVGWLILFGITITVHSQNPDVFPIPETYSVEGIPTIKNSEVEHLFYDPSAIRSNLIWDVDGKNKRMLVTDETNNIYLVNTPLSKPVRLLEKVFPYSVKFSPRGDSFVYMSDHESEDKYQLYLYDFRENSSKKVVSVTGKDESVDSFIWNKLGDSLFFIKVDYDSKVSKLCNFNFNIENCLLTDLKGIWNVLDFDGEKILLKYWKASSSQLLYIYDLQTNKLNPVDEKGNNRKAFLAQNRVFWMSEGSDSCKTETCILSLDLKSNQTTQLKLPRNISNLQDIKISPLGNNLLLQETKDGIDKLHIFRLKKGKIVKEIQPFISGSFVIWHTRWLTNNEVVYTLENIGKPASIKSYNIETKKIIEWTKEKLPTQLENKVKSPEIFKWKSFDQKEIPGYIVRPNNTSAKTPVLIFVHGGPQVLDKPIFNAQDITLASSLGLTIIHTNIRGSSGFGKDFMDADNKEKRGDAVKDIQSLINWIEKQPNLDSNKIYLRGQSYGGFVVVSTALQEPTRIKGVLAEYPIISIRGYLSQKWIDEFSKNEYGDPKDEKLMSKLDLLSPLNNTDKWNNIPLFLTIGKQDARISINDVTDLKSQLQKKGSEVWFISSAKSGHGFGGKYVTAAMFQFLKKQIN